MIPSMHEVIINCIFCLLEDLPSISRKRVYINCFLILSIILASKKVHVYLVILVILFLLLLFGGGGVHQWRLALKGFNRLTRDTECCLNSHMCNVN